MTDNLETRPTFEEIDGIKTYHICLPGDVWVDVPVNDIADIDWNEVVARGLKDALMSKGMSKIKPGITKLEGSELETRRAELREQAEKNKAALLDGSLFRKKAKEKKGALETEAIRIAKDLAMEMVRAAGYNPSKALPKASDKTAAAKRVLANNPHIYDLARENLAKKAEEAKKPSLDLSILGITVDDSMKRKPRAGVKRKPPASVAGVVASKGAVRQRPGVTH